MPAVRCRRPSLPFDETRKPRWPHSPSVGLRGRPPFLDSVEMLLGPGPVDRALDGFFLKPAVVRTLGRNSGAGRRLSGPGRCSFPRATTLSSGQHRIAHAAPILVRIVGVFHGIDLVPGGRPAVPPEPVIRLPDQPRGLGRRLRLTGLVVPAHRVSLGAGGSGRRQLLDHPGGYLGMPSDDDQHVAAHQVLKANIIRAMHYR